MPFFLIFGKFNSHNQVCVILQQKIQWYWKYLFNSNPMIRTRRSWGNLKAELTYLHLIQKVTQTVFRWSLLCLLKKNIYTIMCTLFFSRVPQCCLTGLLTPGFNWLFCLSFSCAFLSSLSHFIRLYRRSFKP